MAGNAPEHGRIAQKRRTRKTIVAAAAQLLGTGVTPSVTDIAKAADVSRRTVYMYFPTLEQLLVDASLLSMTRDTIDAAIDALGENGSAEHRVEVMTRAVQSQFAATEQQGRTLLRLTVDAGRGDRPADEPIRGYRRIEWIERTLAPHRTKLGKAGFERLVSALAMVVGWESLIVARDIRALPLNEAADVSAWAARALVRAALADRKRKHTKERRGK